MKRIPSILSKTKLLRGFHCLKDLYLHIHRLDLEPKITPADQARFDEGNEVGREAQKLFPGGIALETPPWDFDGSVRATTKALGSKATALFEAAFRHDKVFAKADILNKVGHSWELIEVKSSSRKKDEHLPDVAIQAWVASQSGLSLHKASLMYLNKECQFPNLHELFVTEDLTSEIQPLIQSMNSRVKEAFQVMESSTMPDVDLGTQCLRPRQCPFKDFCWTEKGIPEQSVFDLPGIRDRTWDLYREGILSLTDPRLTDLDAIQSRMVQAVRKNRQVVDRKNVQLQLEAWQWPLFVLDFETLNPAIPRVTGMGPYGHVPFQFSILELNSIDAHPKHYEFLYEEHSDPRPELIEALLSSIGPKGSVVAYYKEFEEQRINDLARCFPEKADKLNNIASRLVDPLPIVRSSIYDLGFHGSFSLKAVAPSLLGSKYDYENLEIQDGTAAQRSYAEFVNMPTSAKQRDHLRQELLRYCKQDTLATMDLVLYLFAQ